VPGGLQLLERAAAVIDAVGERGGASLAELVAATGLPRPTVHRLAVALCAQALLRRDAVGGFALGPRLVAWGAQAAAHDPVLDAAPAVVARLRDDTDESAQLYVRQGDRRLCVVAAERAAGLRDTVPVGAVLPLDAGSGGRVLLAWAADAERFPRLGAAALSAVRRRGWAETGGDREPGVASVSAPVFGPDGAVVAAISVSGPVERLGRRPGTRLAAAVVAAARALVA
jgi:DNA-binding IclR family transcriptional regulator